MSRLPKLNPQLLALARGRVYATKQAFMPPGGGDPAAGGGPPPGDPSMGGAPPPMDPSMGGGGPPPGDPSMGGGGDPGAGAGMPGAGGAELDMKVQTAVQQAMQMAGGAGGAGGNGGPGSPKQPKPDINTIATDIFQLKKMFLAYLRRQGIELPPDILDGPNRDPMSGAPALSPTGGSDVAPGASQATSAGAIKPIQPIQPATINAISGGGKTASAPPSTSTLVKEASDLLRLYAVYLEHQDDARDALVFMSKSAEEAAAELVGDPTLVIGEPYPVAFKPVRQLRDKAAAVASMFRSRRG